MLLLYDIGIWVYSQLIKLFALFNQKAKLFVEGRKLQQQRILPGIESSQRHVWFHFASLGEFEQGRPVLEGLIARFPHKKIIITFFSPSGYEIRKDYPLATAVLYLPLDTRFQARQFIAAINPEFAVFTKYEYWYHYFRELRIRNIPLYIISGIFRPEQIFFSWYGRLHRQMLGFVSHFFVQNQQSMDLLESIGVRQVTLSGDTRFDRVATNAEAPRQLDIIKTFCGLNDTLVAGSTWPQDEQLLPSLLQRHPEWKCIIAPHEIHESHIQQIIKLFPSAIIYSQYSRKNDASLFQAQVLVIDNIGMLSSLYQFGKMAYIGGGFGVGIHNTLEAAAFGLPVIFGPKYNKFQEAKDLIAAGAAKSIRSEEELITAFAFFSNNKKAADAAKKYVVQHKGATHRILEYIGNSCV